MATSQVLFASRIPIDLKGKLSRFCAAHGVRMNFLVAQALREKLERVAEDEADTALIQSRHKDAEFATADDMNAYFKKRVTKKR